MNDDELLSNVRKAKQGNKEAKSLVIEECIKYVSKMVRNFCIKNKSLSKEDLMQDGIIGIMKAINSYNKEIKVKFSTYVYTIVKYTLISQIKNKYTFVKIPEHIVSHVVNFKIIKDNPNITNFEINKYDVKEMLRLSNLNNILSLNSNVFTEENLEFFDNINYEDLNYKKVEDRLYLEIISRELNNGLSDLEKYIINKSIIENNTIRSISKEINISPKKLSEVKYLALKKLRKNYTNMSKEKI